MSAFLCNHEHIGLLAAFYRDTQRAYRTERNQDAERTARELAQANIDSMLERYGDKGCGEPEAYIALCQQEARRSFPDTVSTVLILKMLDCLEYQSCEVENYWQTPGFELLQAIRRHAIHRLTGYEDAPGWEYSRASMQKHLDEKRAGVKVHLAFRK